MWSSHTVFHPVGSNAWGIGGFGAAAAVCASALAPGAAATAASARL